MQHFGAFLGTAESIRALPLPDVFSTSGSQHMWIDKFGRAREIFGYARQTTEALLTLDDIPGIVRGLLLVRLDLGRGVNLLIAVVGSEASGFRLWSSTDNGQTFDELAQFPLAQPTDIPDAQQWGAEFYVCLGEAIQPQKGVGVLIPTGLSRSPTPTAAANATAGELIGQYTYRLVSKFADGTRRPGSAPSNVVGPLEEEQVNLTWTADADTAVVGYEIYRTTGTGTLFYYVFTVDGRLTTSFADNVSDLVILEQRSLEEHGDAPQLGTRFVEAHRQRLWWARTNTFLRRAWYSDPGQPESLDLFTQYLEFEDADTHGDVITGMTGEYEGMLIVWLERSIWTVSGTGQLVGVESDWNRQKSNARIGTTHVRNVLKIPAGSTWTDEQARAQVTNRVMLAYLTPAGDIRLFDGTNDTIISFPVADTLKTLTYSARRKAHALIDEERQHAIWFFPTDGRTEPDLAVCWNYRYGVWYVWPDMPFSSALAMETRNAAQRLLTGGNTGTSLGQVFHFFDEGTGTFDGAPIESRWMSKPLYGVDDQGNPALSVTKRFRWADVLYDHPAGVTLDLEWAPGDAQDNFNADGMARVAQMSETEVIRSSNGSIICSADGSNIVITQRIGQRQVSLKRSADAGDHAGDYIEDTAMRLRLQKFSGAGAWALEGLNLAYQLLPGLKRRFRADQSRIAG